MRSYWVLHGLCLAALVALSGGCGHHEDPATVMDELVGEAEQSFHAEEPVPEDAPGPGEDAAPSEDSTETPVVEEVPPPAAGPPPETDVPAPEQPTGF